MNNTNRIGLGTIDQLTGEGTEFLVDANGEPIAEFYNGNFVYALPAGNSTEDTVIGIEE